MAPPPREFHPCLGDNLGSEGVEKEEEVRTIRLAIGSSDGSSVVQDHFGESQVFLVYELAEDGSYRLLEERKNASPQERGGHGREEKRRAVLRILSDCQILVAGKMSPSFARLRDGSPVQPVVTEIDSIPELLAALAARFEGLYGLCQARARGERPREIPMLAKEAAQDG